jgi:hypothetical protein
MIKTPEFHDQAWRDIVVLSGDVSPNGKNLLKLERCALCVSATPP